MTLPSPDRDTDRDWELIGQTRPFYGSLSDPRFDAAELDSEARAAFIASGEADIAHTLSLFQRFFSPPERLTHALDFGCGAGRLLPAMSAHAHRLSAVDISSGMIGKAKSFAPNAVYSRGIPDGPFDWINSLVVFQNILPARGLTLLDELLARAAPDGLLSVHFTISVAPRPDKGDVGRISLYQYDLPTILDRLASAGFSRVVTEYLDHGADKGVRLITARGAFAA